MGKSNSVVWCDRGWLPVHYGFCPSRKAWNKEFKRLIEDKKLRNSIDYQYPTSAGRATFLEENNGGLCCLVTINGDKGQDALTVIGLINHEAVHVWQAICNHIGEEEPSKEFEAYSLQNISMNLISAFESTRRKLTV